MALSRIVAVGNGVTRNFAVSFALGYISTSDVTCRVGTEADGAGNPVYRAITWNSPGIATIAGAIPASGVQVVFDRTVARDKLIVNYENGDIINDVNLNTAQRQAIMLVHEVLDGRIQKLDNNLDMGGFRITGVGDPIADGNAANKRYVDSRINTGATNATRAEVAAAASEASNQQSASRAAAASASQSAAYQSEQTASNRAAAALVSQNAAAADRAQTGQDRTQTGQDRTAVRADAVQTAADRIATGQDRSAVRSDAVQTAQDRAVVREDRTAVRADAVQTAADRVATGNDRTQTGADRTATGQDRTAVNQAVGRAQAWANQAEDQVVADGQYSAYHWAQKAMDYAGGEIEMSSVVGLNQALLNKLTRSGDSMTGALTLSTGADDGRAPLRFSSMSGSITVADGDVWMTGSGIFVRFGGLNRQLWDAGTVPIATAADISTPTGTNVRMFAPAQINAVASARASERVAKNGGDTMSGAFKVVGTTGATARVSVQTLTSGQNAHFELQGTGGGERSLMWILGNGADGNVYWRASMGTAFVLAPDANIFTKNGWLHSTRDGYTTVKVGVGDMTFINGNHLLWHWNGSQLYYRIDAQSQWTQIGSNANSDERVKKNIREATDDAITLLNELRPVTYEYKQKTSLGQPAGNRYGFIAQDLQYTLPNSVIDVGMPESEDTVMQLAPDAPMQLIAVLVKAVQNLSARVADLEKEKDNA